MKRSANSSQLKAKFEEFVYGLAETAGYCLMALLFCGWLALFFGPTWQYLLGWLILGAVSCLLD